MLLHQNQEFLPLQQAQQGVDSDKARSLWMIKCLLTSFSKTCLCQHLTITKQLNFHNTNHWANKVKDTDSLQILNSLKANRLTSVTESNCNQSFLTKTSTRTSLTRFKALLQGWCRVQRQGWAAIDGRFTVEHLHDQFTTDALLPAKTILREEKSWDF